MTESTRNSQKAPLDAACSLHKILMRGETLRSRLSKFDSYVSTNKSMYGYEESKSPILKSPPSTAKDEKDENSKFKIPVFQVKNLRKFGATNRRQNVCQSFRECDDASSLVPSSINREKKPSKFKKYMNANLKKDPKSR